MMPERITRESLLKRKIETENGPPQEVLGDVDQVIIDPAKKDEKRTAVYVFTCVRAHSVPSWWN